MAQLLLTPLNEQHLISMARAGDDTSFDILMRQYAESVYRLALRMLGNNEDAEDVQQETFILAYRQLRVFRGEASIGTWLYAIAARLCLSTRRRTMRRPPAFPVDDIMLTSSSREDPAQRQLLREQGDRVQRALMQLSAADRLLIILKYIEGLSHEEIARVLRCSVESSRSRLTRAKKLFRERYE
jgi:RNA polymerase sigma-70 factor (ECF subfamily)